MSFKIRMLLVSLMLFAVSGALCAKKYFVLYGFKLGQKMDVVRAQLGKPHRTHTFTDGYKAYIYIFREKNHYLIFTCTKNNADLIWGIQLSGTQNPAGHGLDSLQLGDGEKSIVAKFGAPDKKRAAVDEINSKRMKGIVYYSYNGSANFSIEVKNKKVSSIKINYKGPVQKPVSVGIVELITLLKNKNYYKLCEMISYDFSVIKKGRRIYSKKSILHALLKDPFFRNVFFNKKNGIISIKKKNITNVALRMVEEQGRMVSGRVYYIHLNGQKYELFFTRSYTGIVLRYINIL